MTDTLTLEQKRDLFRDGFIVLRNIIPNDLIARALSRIKNGSSESYLGSDSSMTDLLSKSPLSPMLHEAMGLFDPPITSQMGIRNVAKPGDYFNNLGYRERDMPYFGAEVHVDGSCTIAIPQEVQTGTPDEIYHRYIASGPKGDLGRSPEVMGHNMVPLFQDPEMTLGLGSFTAFVFVSLSDQSKEGCGQTALLKGAHHEIERFFRYQRDTNNHLGVEGPGWPRLDFEVPNRCGLVYTPQVVLEHFVDDESECTPDGRKWPRPTPILMEPGDACITVYQMPHTATRNEKGTESRKTVIFRIRNKIRQPNVMVNGISDHPDRGQRGEWLEFEPGNNPWERSKYAMCNMWHEWQGMSDVVSDVQRAQNHVVSAEV